MEDTQASHLVQFLFESQHFMLGIFFVLKNNYSNKYRVESLLTHFLNFFIVCRVPGIQYLLMMLVSACAFMHGLEAVWKLQFFWKMNAHS
jgi:hypothetical protein